MKTQIQNINEIPLCVRLNGTLIATNVFWEAFAAMLNKNPLLIMLVPFWLIRGVSVLEQKIFENSDIEVRFFPYRKKLIDFIKFQKDEGRKTILITNNFVGFSEKIFRYLGIFDSIIADYEVPNIKKKLVAVYGANGFDYVGCDADDLQIFETARLVYLVEPSPTLIAQAKKNENIETVFKTKKDKVQIFFQTIHIERQIKSLLVFIPLLFLSNQLIYQHTVNLIISFITYFLITSASYLFNDISDLSYDRKNKLKFRRPLALGLFSIKNAVVLSAVFLIVGMFFSIYFLPPQFNLFLFLFIFLSFTYSSFFKIVPIFDILLLSSLLLIRLISGYAVCGLEVPNPYLYFYIAVSVFFIVFQKYSELSLYEKNNVEVVNRNYYKLYNQKIFLIIGVILSVVSSFFLYNILGIGIGDINCINICFLALFVLFQGVLWYIAINKYFTINLLISFIKEPFINVLLIIFVILVVILKL